MGCQMNKPEQVKNLLKCVGLFASTDIFGKPGASFWWKMIKFAHTHGYLYTSFDKDEIDTAMIMYRVKDRELIDKNTLPEKEEGDILYVLACASRSRDKLKLNKIKNYVVNHFNEINKIAFNHRNNDDDFRIYEVRNGKAQQTEFSRPTAISA